MVIFNEIEFDSPRIKGVIIDEKCKILSSGTFEWKNKLTNDYWPYHERSILLLLNKLC